MELDELRKHWNTAVDPAKIPQTVDYDGLKKKMDEPLRRLRRKFRNRMLLVPVVCTAFITEMYLMHSPQLHRHYINTVSWLFIPLCIAMMAYFYANYRILVQLQQMDKPVKATLAKQVYLLEKLAWWRLNVFRVLMVIFMVMLETVFYVSDDKQNFPAWWRLSLSFRVGGYILFFILYYYFSKYLIRYQYLYPVRKLKDILNQTNEGE